MYGPYYQPSESGALLVQLEPTGLTAAGCLLSHYAPVFTAIQLLLPTTIVVFMAFYGHIYIARLYHQKVGTCFVPLFLHPALLK